MVKEERLNCAMNSASTDPRVTFSLNRAIGENSLSRRNQWRVPSVQEISRMSAEESCCVGSLSAYKAILQSTVQFHLGSSLKFYRQNVKLSLHRS